MKYLLNLFVMMRLTTISLLMFCLLGDSAAQSAHKLLREGDKSYDQEQYDLAEESYRKAKSKGSAGQGSYNLGNTVYQQERYEEAIDHYKQSVSQLSDPKDQSEALFNLGNAQIQAQQLEDAIESYKEAIDLNPSDDEIRQNLYVAKLMRIEQMKQEQQQQQQEQQQEGDESQQDQQQDQQQGEGQQQDQQPASQDESNEEGSEAQEQSMDLSKEDAEKLLQVIENEEKNVQEKLRKSYGNKKKPKKDW